MGWSFRKQLEELDRLGKEETDEESLMSEDEPSSVSPPSRSRAHTSRRSSTVPAGASSSKQPLLHSSRSSPRLRMGESRSRPQLDASREGSQSPSYYASTVRRRSMITVSPHSCAEIRRGSSRSPSGDSDISSSPAQVVDADFAAVNQMENFDSFRRPSSSASVPKTVLAEKASPFRDSSPTSSKTSLSSILNPVPFAPSAEFRSQTSPRKTLMISNSGRSPRRSAPYPSRLKHQKLNSSYHGHCPPCQSLREHYRVGICY
ncbi:hypothetical protein BT96DRAFT_447205 [Gymnopus androsaceus JB14]|uniref:Uncharacterized protein n=1 Tax=Gymnopus androsaceus JB14 TaxID=1447944 RepID=A0A6A4I4E4_9AGAR|nr:hypothetical protein BT96DRAFT_447205 [Gymnopus androsaceus JB14]